MEQPGIEVSPPENERTSIIRPEMKGDKIWPRNTEDVDEVHFENRE